MFLRIIPLLAPWRSGYAEVCKTVYTGSNPVGASTSFLCTAGSFTSRLFWCVLLAEQPAPLPNMPYRHYAPRDQQADNGADAYVGDFLLGIGLACDLQRV